MKPIIDTLNRRFRVVGKLQFVDNGHGLPVAEIETAQASSVEFTGETDRIYINTTADCRIEDRLWQRTRHVAKAGSTSTVVWNPWRARTGFA